MSATAGFRRLILELGHGAADPATMRQAAAFARLVDAELHALFIEDETLLNVCALPFAREISPLSLEWRPLKPDRLEAELRAAAARARRNLEAAARAAGVGQTFEVRRGDLGVKVTETCVASDIMVIASPRLEATHGSQRWRETAHRSVASVLFLPPDSGRRHGSVVAVITSLDDPSLAVARGIAARGRESLVVLALPGSEVGNEVGGSVIRLLRGRSREDIVNGLGETRERLIVITRDESPSGPMSPPESGPELVAARGAAVLVVEPPGAPR